MTGRKPFAIAAALAAGTVGACSSLTPSTTAESHCSKVLRFLAEGAKYSEDEVQERERFDGADRLVAVTIVYVQGEARRLMTCLYRPGRANEAVGLSYLGQRLPPERVAAANAAARR